MDSGGDECAKGEPFEFGASFERATDLDFEDIFLPFRPVFEVGEFLPDLFDWRIDNDFFARDERRILFNIHFVIIP